jgi:OOP family OmpA-OmpF porin
VTPLVLGLLGKHAINSNLNSDGIANFLSDQGDYVKAAMPAGLNISNLFSWNTNTSNQLVEPAPVMEKNSWMMPLLLVALAALAIWFFANKGCNKTDESTIVLVDSAHGVTSNVAVEPANSSLGTIDTETGDWIYDVGDMVTIDLPNNAGELTVGTNSTEYKLINFLNDNTASIDEEKGNWFEFTNVHFKKGGADLTDASMDQLKNLVTISKAYPAAQFKLGGYTDNTGNDEINIPLSQKRAAAVAEMVKQLGASKNSIVGAEGYGMQWPIADNVTPEGRAQNRRVAVNVKAK